MIAFYVGCDIDIKHRGVTDSRNYCDWVLDHFITNLRLEFLICFLTYLTPQPEGLYGYFRGLFSCRNQLRLNASLTQVSSRDRTIKISAQRLLKLLSLLNINFIVRIMDV